jgi:hypothetical protein
MIQIIKYDLDIKNLTDDQTLFLLIFLLFIWRGTKFIVMTYESFNSNDFLSLQKNNKKFQKI